MRNTKHLLLFFVSLFYCCTAFAQRESILFDDGWRFAFGNAADPKKDFGAGTEYFNYLTKAMGIHNEGPYSAKFDDSAWQEVRVPHDWVATLPYASDASHSHGYKTVGYKYPETSVGWYRKVMHIGKEDEGKHLSLRFDGIFRNAQVWMNGVYMGTEPSGYVPQVYDVTDYVKYGEDNIICVRADATYEEGWFYEGSGIYRDVWLDKRSKVGIDTYGTFVYATDHHKDAKVRDGLVVEAEVNNASLKPCRATVCSVLYDAEGREVCTSQEQPLSLAAKETKKCKDFLYADNLRLWSPSDPYIYKVETRVKVDGEIVDRYVTMTGKRYIEFDADKGFLLNGKQIKLKGVNMHQDHAGVGSAIPDALSAYRIKKLKEMGCNAYRASHNPVTASLLDICDREGMMVIDENRLMGVNREHLHNLEAMIRRDRNHPSVILWSNGNEEWGLENNIQGTRMAASMREYTRLLDPTRPSTVANAGGGELIKGLDVVGYNYIVQNSVEDRRREHPDWKIVGTEETTGCGTRGVYFNDPAVPGRMKSMNLGTEPGVENVIERGWQFYADREWASGVFFWTGFDYRGEPNPLSYPATDSEFGILDYCGFPKDEAWYLKSWWTDDTTLHIFPHWNLTGHEGENIELWAYSNCDEVELTVNGKSLGRQRMPRNGHLKWNAVYRPGKVVAKGYRNGKLVKTEVMETTKAASQMTVVPDRSAIVADGRDVSVVNISMRDMKGRLVPDACNTLTFTLTGEGRIIGAGNGDPSYLGADHPQDKDCQSFTIPAFNGYAQLLVQSTKTPGTITITCTSPDIKTASVTVNTGK